MYSDTGGTGPVVALLPLSLPALATTLAEHLHAFLAELGGRPESEPSALDRNVGLPVFRYIFLA